MKEITFLSPVNIGDDIYLLPAYNGKYLGNVVADKVQLVGFSKRNIHIKARNNHEHNKMYILGKNCFADINKAKQALEDAREKGGIL